MGNRALKLMVILLCTINAVMWQMYTQAPMMAALWAATAIAFAFWIADDMRR